MQNLEMVSLAGKDISQLHKPLDTCKRLAADFSTVMWNVPNLSFSCSRVREIVAHLANVNRSIVLWALSHPLCEKVKTSAVPCSRPRDGRTGQALRAVALQPGTVPAQRGMGEEAAVWVGLAFIRTRWSLKVSSKSAFGGVFETLKYFESFFFH